MLTFLLVLFGLLAILTMGGCSAAGSKTDRTVMSEGSYSSNSGVKGETTWTWNQQPNRGADEKPSTAPTQEPTARRE